MEMAMNPLEFSQLLNTLDKQGASKDKKALIQTAAAGNTFTCAQVAQILDKLTFPKEQLWALKIFRPRISDRENTFQIIQAFTFTKDQKKAGELLGQPEDVEPAVRRKRLDEESEAVDMPAPMEASAFSQLLEALSNQKFPKEQLYLVELAAYRNTFTAEQAVQLLDKFKIPRYQLKALNIIRHRITDSQSNFLILNAFDSSLYKKKASTLLMQAASPHENQNPS
ncbi:MAG: hypothetical protein DRR08_17240 [Candidatus Parabeggiatoa sp. nov. 2]|nr:MAG: hypothetical protein B6247_21940 [Beggiatoa sp. 4572_84]RKZ58118.1 MAG: hypothetical protein DRR08_17240 [Gammaproteobacteria bacterium]